MYNQNTNLFGVITVFYYVDGHTVKSLIALYRDTTKLTELYVLLARELDFSKPEWV